MAFGANPYKINDKLYALYTRAYEYRHAREGMELADSLYRQALALKDTKAQCMALTIPFIYYCEHDTTGNDMEQALRTLQTRAMDTGHTRFYYEAMTGKVDYLIKQRRMSEALRFIMHTQRIAKKQNDPYGLYAGYHSLARVYMEREEMNLAAAAYRDALELARTKLPEQDFGADYLGLVYCYKLTGNYEKMRKNALWGVRYAKSELIHHPLRVALAYAYFMEGQDGYFLTQYAKVQEERIDYIVADYSAEYLELDIINLIISGEYDKAREAIPMITPVSQQLRMLCTLNMRQGNYREAVDNMTSLFRQRNMTAQTVFNQDISVMNARLNNQRLESEKRDIALRNAQLELSNTQLALTNSSLELGRIRNKERLSRLHADNASLTYNNRMLAAKRQQDSLIAQQRLREAMTKELRLRSDILGVLLGVAVIGLGLTCGIIYTRRKMTRRLRQANEGLQQANRQLTVANDKALQADRMKTMFIQNMSHEIRTPLNAIVGFSQLLSDEENSRTLSKEEREEMRNLVKDNSDLLTTIINDILDITALESGKYVMKFSDVKVNALCQNAIATVSHRLTEGVTMMFDTDLPDSFTIHTDQQRVKQVIINLLTNAEKNTTQGSITLKAEETADGKTLFTVTDTGVGIPEKKMEVIFERFKKLDKYKQGSGLGLSICRTIAEKLGGQVDVDRQYKDGARFFFSVKNG